LHFFVDGFGTARDGFEHGVGAEGVHVGTGVGEGQALRDALEREGGMESEPGRWLVFGNLEKSECNVLPCQSF
jgi:hypothetical protein